MNIHIVSAAVMNGCRPPARVQLLQLRWQQYSAVLLLGFDVCNCILNG